MIIEGQFTVPAPRDRVWAAIWDIPTLASWVPGCTSAVAVDESTYRARLEQQVGFLKAAFDLLLHVVDVEEPHRIRLQGEGEDSRLRSSVRIDSEVRLDEDGPSSTRFAYRHDLSIFGRVGALGFPIIQRKAREVEGEFARRATAHLAGA